MQDVLLKATIEGGIRMYILSAQNVVEKARVLHNCSSLAISALGRTLMGGLLLAATMKNDEAITIKISGDGPLGDIVVDACGGNVRGYVDNTTIELPLTADGKPAVAEAVGPTNGNITVRRFNKDKQPFTGSCNLACGEIAEDITRYLYVSEQTPSSVALGVCIDTDSTVKHAGGFLIQPMPEADENSLIILEENITNFAGINNSLTNGKTLEEIIQTIAGPLKVNLYETIPLQFICQCSHERILDMFSSLGKKELYELSQDANTEVVCHFCNKKYLLSTEELKNLADSL